MTVHSSRAVPLLLLNICSSAGKAASGEAVSHLFGPCQYRFYRRPENELFRHDADKVVVGENLRP